MICEGPTARHWHHLQALAVTRVFIREFLVLLHVPLVVSSACPAVLLPASFADGLGISSVLLSDLPVHAVGMPRSRKKRIPLRKHTLLLA